MMKLLGLAAITVSFLTASASHAAVVVYDDKSLFLGDTSATSVTGPLPNLGTVGVGPVTVGGATFTAPGDADSLHFGAPSADWTALHPGVDLAISGDEDLNVDLAVSGYAFGFDFVEVSSGPPGICGFGCTDSTFVVQLLAGAAVVDTFSFNVPDDQLAFVGAWSDQLFNRVQIVELGGNVDDEYYGQFYQGLVAPSTDAVPAPAALALLGLGLLGLGLRRRNA